MDIPPDVAGQCCTEQHLRELSRHVHDWKSIIGDLGFENTRVIEADIELHCPWNLQQQTTEMFLRWKDYWGMKATYGELIHMFVKLRKLSYAEKLCEIVYPHSRNGKRPKHTDLKTPPMSSYSL